ncbi:glutathione ABC transporter permease [Alicyclobacillus acidoterrestris]|uniref:ABC transporter permease n=1 Tax=Alicyclobacillus suci TaxID=2816080 RepID=UPI0011940FF4|nr:ABC transporter permease [Alicyclobacillus suci]GEO24240.1 glutathione ABC transporter permease [Alicyclobacillus acidoterrestris]
MMLSVIQAVRRLFGGFMVLLAVSILLFVVSKLMGDPSYSILSIDATQSQRAAFRAEIGWNQSFWAQLLQYIGRTVTGHFGNSYEMQQPVSQILVPYVWGTVKLVGLSLPLGMFGGIVFAFLSLWASDRTERMFQRFLLLLYSLPGFVPVILAIEIFGVKLKWFPPSGSQGIQSLVMPVVLLAGSEAIKSGLLLRTKLREVMEEKFVVTARAKGLAPRRLYIQYLLRPALILVFSYLSIQVGQLLGSTIIVENIFAYEGVGSLAIHALSTRDLPLLQGCIFVPAIIFLVLRFVTDLVQPWLDPRLQQAGRRVSI